MYAAVVVSSSGKVLPTTVEMNNSFRRLRSFIEKGLRSGELQRLIMGMELDGFDPDFADQIIITSTNRTKAGHQRMSFSI